MAAFFIASGYGFRKRSIAKCIQQQLKSLLKPYCTRRCSPACCTLSFIIRRSSTCPAPSQSIKVTGGFLLGLPRPTYFGQEFFSCGPMWYLLALMVGWVLLDGTSSRSAMFTGLWQAASCCWAQGSLV